MYGDSLENPEVLADLRYRLDNHQISMFLTDKPWQKIFSPKPFLYFRNPYLRFDLERNILDFHLAHPHIPYICTSNKEIVSVSPISSGSNTFVLKNASYLVKPSIPPLPILIGTHCRPNYFRFTMNSLLNSVSADSEQKIYIVGSQPDVETSNIIEEIVNSHSNVEAVICNKNLKYSFANFGSKFFGLANFIHFEDDGIIPDHIRHNVPYWTRQLAHRVTTSDVVAVRTFEGNWASEMYSCGILNDKPLYKFDDSLWHYLKKADAEKHTLPIGGLGFVINSEKMYRNFDTKKYATSDSAIIAESKSLCILNIPIYHIGANQKMDYKEYIYKKIDVSVDREQLGKNLRTGEERAVDLSADWKTLSAPG